MLCFWRLNVELDGLPIEIGRCNCGNFFSYSTELLSEIVDDILGSVRLLFFDLFDLLFAQLGDCYSLDKMSSLEADECLY
ncbi:hypothetical protein AUR65_011870 [Haloferax marisrubri]|uniref:Uncharacterized protein n=1 Tax=Haloferax marisrubri TaxID=1544719 RepID=A0A2P4NPP0_9EURY|nr:hypothetical protein AUR65_011870 [Haloferax marisrubri]